MRNHSTLLLIFLITFLLTSGGKMGEAKNRSISKEQELLSERDLAKTYRAKGQIYIASQHLERSLEILEEINPEEAAGNGYIKSNMNYKMDLASTLNNLANLNLNMGYHNKAEPLFKRSFQITEEAAILLEQSTHEASVKDEIDKTISLPTGLFMIGQTNSLTTANYINMAYSQLGLAIIYNTTGKYIESEQLYSQSLKLFEEYMVPDHFFLSLLLSNLGDFYRIQDRCIEAESFYKRSLEIKEKSVKPNKYDLMCVLNNLAMCLIKTGKLEEVESIGKRVVRLGR